MKSKKPSKKNFKNSDFEKNDFADQFGKGVKKDKSSKRRLSIYDEFDEEDFDDLTNDSETDYLYDDEDDDL